MQRLTAPPLIRVAPRSGFALGGARARMLRVALTAVVLAPIVGFMPGPRRLGGFSTKEDIARATVMKYAHEAYPRWVQAHPARRYPDDLVDLSAYMNARDTKDPWGTPYVMLRQGGIVVMSAGPDALFGTGDDIWSNE